MLQPGENLSIEHCSKRFEIAKTGKPETIVILESMSKKQVTNFGLRLITLRLCALARTY